MAQMYPNASAGLGENMFGNNEDEAPDDDVRVLPPHRLALNVEQRRWQNELDEDVRQPESPPAPRIPMFEYYDARQIRIKQPNKAPKKAKVPVQD